MTSDGDKNHNKTLTQGSLRRRSRDLALRFAPKTVATLISYIRTPRMPRLGLLRYRPERLASQIKFMADTGAGTDACLAAGSLPLPVHFYSPVPDIGDLKDRQVFARRSALGGIEMRLADQLALLAELGTAYGEECQWRHDPTGDPHTYVTSASGFSFGCASALHALLRHCKPKRVIEIGSGWSSRVINTALALNQN